MRFFLCIGVIPFILAYSKNPNNNNNNNNNNNSNNSNLNFKLLLQVQLQVQVGVILSKSTSSNLGSSAHWQSSPSPTKLLNVTSFISGIPWKLQLLLLTQLGRQYHYNSYRRPRPQATVDPACSFLPTPCADPCQSPAMHCHYVACRRQEERMHQCS